MNLTIAVLMSISGILDTILRRGIDMTKETQSNFKDMVDVFYFVQLPYGDWTIARQDSNGDWWLCDDCPSPMDTEYFMAIGDYIPVPHDGNHLNIQW
jgi:hypothetical protein